MTSKTIPAACFALPFLLITAGAAHAQAIACADLAAIVESADADFAPIRGPLQSSIMPGGSPLPRAPVSREPMQATPHATGRTETTREFEKRVLSTKFEVHRYATTRPLAGAGSCEIRLMHKEDDRAALRETTYRCDWPTSPEFAALKRSVTTCLANVAMREETAESLRLYIERDASGDGERSVQVSVEAGGAKAARLSITRTICRSRAAGACGER